MKLLLACEESCTVREAFRQKGIDAYSCDLQQAHRAKIRSKFFQGMAEAMADQWWHLLDGTCF